MVAIPRRLSRVAQLALGLLLGLGAAEGLFHARDRGAFPLVNVYEPDAERGVRLAPGAVTHVGLPGERVTRVRVNREGYRGAEWPAPSPGEILVVGDSLSFGLGVEEDEALAARLRAALPGAPPVLDASVPTWGPPEYAQTVTQLLGRRRPRAVVVVLNLLNDLAEIDRPNCERHAALDGWAVRLGPERRAPESSPWRASVIRRSHAAFALWRWRRTRELQAATPAVDDGPDGLLALAARVAADDRAVDDHRRRAAVVAAAERELGLAHQELSKVLDRHEILPHFQRAFAEGTRISMRSELPYGDPELGDDWAWRGERADDADIFVVRSGGCGASVWPLSRILSWRGAGKSDVHAEIAAKLRSIAQMVSPEAGREVTAALARRAAAVTRLAASPRSSLPPAPALEPLPILSFLRELRERVEPSGTRLVLVVAPLDVQISPQARARRGLTEAQVTTLDALTEALAHAAPAWLHAGIDATPALRPLGAAAYLPDGHLSPAGHEALARAVAPAVAD